MLQPLIHWAIARNLTKKPELISLTVASGGSINQVAQVTFADRKPFFIKWNPGMGKAFFEAEANGLNALAASQCVRTPRVIDLVELAGDWVLILEAVVQGKRSPGFEEIFGHQLALLHQTQTDEFFGFTKDNFIGSTPQLNANRSSNWREFFIGQRLQPQLKMAREKGLVSSEQQRVFEQCFNTLETILPARCIPSLIHGDLWSGNLLADERGEPVLIDPAVYYAHHEAEFGMTRLFGGFSPRFEAAYKEVYPFAEGAEERIPAYTLYHVLNHLNLFGSSYANQAYQLAKRYT